MYSHTEENPLRGEWSMRTIWFYVIGVIVYLSGEKYLGVNGDLS